MVTKESRSQFTIAELLWITLWVCVFLASLRMVSWEPLYSELPIVRYSSSLVLIFGLFGVWRKQPLAWGLLGFAAWLMAVLLLLPVFAGARE